MKKPQKKFTIIVMTFIAILIAASFFFVSRSNLFMSTAVQTASQTLTQLLDSKVEIGSVRVTSLTSIKANNVTIYDKSENKLISSDEVTVNFRPMSILKGDITGSIAAVTVYKPLVHIEQRDNGTWNYSDLLSDKQTGNNFHGLVEAKGGQVELVVKKQKYDFAAVNAAVDFAQASKIGITADFVYNATNFTVSGSLEDDEKHFNIKADKLDALAYLPLLPADVLPTSIVIDGGSVENVNLTADLSGSEVIALKGTADIKDASCQVAGVQLEKINSKLVFNKDFVTVFAKAIIKGQALDLHGKVSLVSDPTLSLVVHSDALNPKNILSNIPFDGDVAFSAQISGTASNPRVDAELSAAKAQIYGYAIQNAKVNGTFVDNILYINDVSSNFGGGYISASGTVDTNSKAYTAKIKLKDIDISVLNTYLPDASGIISADAVIAGNLNDMNSVEGYGTVSANNAAYKSIRIDKATATLTKQENTINLKAATISLLNGGKVAASGTINDQDIDIEFYGSSVDLSLLQQYTNVPASGLADFYGHLQGSVGNPYLMLELGAVNGQIMQQPYRNLCLSAQGNVDGINISRFTITNDANEIVHSGYGVVGLTGSKEIDLTINSKNARMENLAAAFFPGQPITGNVDNTVHVTGTVDNIMATGHVLFHEGSYHGILLTMAQGDYIYSNGNLTLHDFAVQSPFANAYLNGTLNGNNLKFDVSIKDIDLAKMPSYLPYPIEGKANFAGHLGGTTDNIEFSSEMQAEELTFNGEKLQNVIGECDYENGQLSLHNVQWQQGNGQILLSAKLNTSNGTMDGKLLAQQVKAQSLAAMGDLKNDYLTGVFNGEVDLSGNINDPDLHFSGCIDDGYLKKRPLQKMTIDASYSNGVISVNQFYGEQDNGRIAAKGTWNLNGSVDMVFSCQDIDVSLLTGFLDYDVDATGTINAYAQISGASISPQANVSFEVNNGGIGTATFDKMTGLLNLDKGVIDVNQILLTKGQYKASANGKVPLIALKAKPWQMLTNYEQIDLNLSLDNADLNILSFLTKHVEWGLGPLKGNVKINGTLAHPLFSGFIQMDDGALKIKELKTPIEKMKIDIAFDREKMKINTFTGEIGSGTYSLTGDTLITGGGLHQYNFNLNADKLLLDSSFYRGPLSGQFTLTEESIFNRKMPKLAGSINIEKSTISFPGVPDTSASLLPEMLLDVGINVGDNVRLYQSMLYDMDVNGNIHFAGTSEYPMPSGEIDVLNGDVEYMHNIFKIREGNAYFNQVGSFLPTITFKADTNLAATKINLDIEGPVGNMRFLLTSEPPMSQSEIIKLLTFRNSSGENVTSSDLAQLATIGLQLSFFNGVENFVRDTLRLDEFNILSDTVYGENGHRGTSNADEIYNIEIGKYISNKVMLKYTDSLNYDKQKYGVQYDLSKNMSLLNEWDNKDGYRMTLQANIKF